MYAHFIACEQTQFHRDSDCFACIIGSHGNEKPRSVDSLPTCVYYRDHCIYGVDDDTVTTKSIIEKVIGVEGLQDKPKMFFIQVRIFEWLEIEGIIWYVRNKSAFRINIYSPFPFIYYVSFYKCFLFIIYLEFT